MIKNIIFDFDGVLVDSEILMLKSFRQYLSKRNIFINEKEFVNYAGNKTINVVKELSYRLNIQDTQKFYNDIMMIANKIYNNELTTVVGTKKFLYQINQQKFIASNSGKERIIQGLKNVNLSQFFEEKNIFSFDMVNKPKPDPDLFLKVIENTNIDSDETIIIEDSIAGVQAGVSANIKVLALTAGEHWFEERSSQPLIDAGAYAVVKNYEDLLIKIKEL